MNTGVLARWVMASRWSNRLSIIIGSPGKALCTICRSCHLQTAQQWSLTSPIYVKIGAVATNKTMCQRGISVATGMVTKTGESTFSYLPLPLPPLAPPRLPCQQRLGGLATNLWAPIIIANNSTPSPCCFLRGPKYDQRIETVYKLNISTTTKVHIQAENSVLHIIIRYECLIKNLQI